MVETNVVADAAQVKIDATQKRLADAILAMEAAEAAIDCLSVKTIVEFCCFR